MKYGQYNSAYLQLKHLKNGHRLVIMLNKIVIV